MTLDVLMEMDEVAHADMRPCIRRFCEFTSFRARKPWLVQSMKGLGRISACLKSSTATSLFAGDVPEYQELAAEEAVALKRTRATRSRPS